MRGPGDSWPASPPGPENAGTVGWLTGVTVLWLWAVNAKRGRLGRTDKRYVEHRINVAIVAHKMQFVVTFNEPLARRVRGPRQLMHTGFTICA